MVTTSFPVNSRVILMNLVKGTQYNGKIGIIKSPLEPSSNRQEVHIIDAAKTVALRPSNLQYEPRKIGTLSIKEMRTVLKAKGVDEREMSGLEKHHLSNFVEERVEDDVEVAKILAQSNAPSAAASSVTATTGDTVLHSLAEKLLMEGNEALNRGDARNALRKFMASREKGRAIRDRSVALRVEGNALGSLGLAHRYLGQYKEAIECHTAAVAISREMGDRRLEGLNLGNLGSDHSFIGQVRKAIEIYTTALAIARETRDLRGEGNNLGNLGIAYSGLGEYQKAIQNHTAALAIARETGDRRGEGLDLGNIGMAYTNLAQYNKAIENFTASVAIAKEIEDRRAEGNGLTNLGSAFCSLGHYDKAIENHTIALSIAREIGDRRMEGGVLGNLGMAHDSLGQYQKAIQHHTAALSIAREIGDRRGVGSDLCNLGGTYQHLSQYDNAIENLFAALVIAQEIGDKQMEGSIYSALGSAFSSLRQYNKAIKNYTAGLAVAREIGDRQLEGAHQGNIGSTYLSLGQYKKAITNLSAALAISRDTGDKQAEGRMLGNLAGAHLRLGQHHKVLEKDTSALGIAREIGDRKGEANRLGNLGVAYSGLGDYKNAIKHHEGAIAICCEIGDREEEGRSLCNLGIAYEELKDYGRAAQYLMDAISVYNGIWSNLHDDQHRITYDDGNMQQASRSLQRVYSALSQHEDALECAEQARSRSFELLLVQQRVQEGTVSGESLVPPSVAASDISSMRDVAVRQRSAIITFSQVSNDTILAWVVRSEPSHQLFSKSLLIRSEDDCLMRLSQLVETVRRSLRAPARQGSNAGSCSPPNKAELLTAPYVDEDALYSSAAQCATLLDGTVPSQDRMRSAFLPPTSSDRAGDNPPWSEKELQDMASRKLLRHCYNIFVEPLLPALSGESQLIIIPDRDLYALPFAALLDGDGKHLIEHFSIRLAPSAGTLVELEKRVKDRDSSNALGYGNCNDPLSAVIVGNPDFNGWFCQLPGSELEGQEVKYILEQAACCPLLVEGEDATKDRIKSEMQSSEVIHLATHGTGDAIFLSGKTKDEGKLSMAEVQELRLERVRLVVLSACDTFNGELRADGVVGISRAFVAAGAPALLATLWIVSDHATHTLMSRFYRRLFASVDGAVDVGSALRDTMISMIHDGSFQVYEWAPFVLYGLSLDFCMSEGKSVLQQEMEDLLSNCRLLVEKKYESILPVAMQWCKDNGVGRVSEIVARQQEEEFADALGLLPSKRKILFRHLKKVLSCPSLPI